MPQPFLDISFPPYVARGATGGPGFSTTVVSLASGKEQRNAQTKRINLDQHKAWMEDEYLKVYEK